MPDSVRRRNQTETFFLLLFIRGQVNRKISSSLGARVDRSPARLKCSWAGSKGELSLVPCRQKGERSSGIWRTMGMTLERDQG